MDLSLLTTQTVITFLLILFRIGGMLMTAPFFSGKGIPQQAKIGFAFTIALLIFPFHSMKFVVPTDMIQFAVIAFQEIVIGLLLGFVADLVFIGLQMAGEFVSVQTGMSMTTVLDPVSGVQMPAFGQLFFYFGLLLFFVFNIHHALILAVNHSFTVLPLGHFFNPASGGIGVLTERFLFLSGQMFTTALMIAAPVLGILLVSEVALAFVAKVMPQMNIFVVAMPLKVIIGITAMGICIPVINELMQGQFADMYAHLKLLLK